MTYTATYSPEDNKLRLYASSRLEKELYERVRAAGFIWAPKQELFVAPAWTPSREDLLLELCGEIGDEDTSLVDRAEQRAERFEDYSDARKEDAERAREAVSKIADNIPLGQPILVGHHSERHARKDAERIENGMRKAVKMWETAQYWQDRARGAIRHAKYKELPSVRARRVKAITADLRKQERERDRAVKCSKFWNGELVGTAKATGTTVTIPVDYKSALWFCNGYENVSACFPLAKYPRQEPASQYEGVMSLWSALGGSDGIEHAVCTLEQAREIAISCHKRTIARADRWISHYNNRLEYERAMLAESGGTAADRTKPEVGGACRAWCSWRGGFSTIQKVNKVSVTLLDNWGNGGADFPRTIPFDKLSGLMSKADVDAARAAGRLIGETSRGFHLAGAEPPTPKPPAPEEPKAAAFEAMRDSLRQGVQVVSAPQLFPTPPDVAARMVEFAEIEPGQRVLEPSAGTGNLLRAIRDAEPEARVTAVELNQKLADMLSTSFNPRPAGWAILSDDFLTCNGNLGQFDRVLMNPPFQDGSDIKHIQHALTFLKLGGCLVALCANGPRQNDKLRPLADEWEELPEDTFAGTGVHAALLVIHKPAERAKAESIPPVFAKVGENLRLF